MRSPPPTYYFLTTNYYMGIVAKQSVRLHWPQSQAVPVDGYYQVFRDGADTPENDAPIPAWPDGIVLLGWGQGGWGQGGWGTGGQDLSLIADDVEDGVHEWRLASYDSAGNASAGDPTASLVLAGQPEAPAAARPESYDDGEGVLAVAFTLSPDDEG